MSAEFKIAETSNFIRKIRKRAFGSVYEKIYNYCYPQLKSNPYFGLNIKKLKGEFENIYRYRIGKFRLFYTVDSELRIVFILDIDYRKDVY